MATYYARKAGNINAADVWSTTPSGTASNLFPTFTNADVLVANSFNITVNVSTTVAEWRNDTTGGATIGGSFLSSTDVTVKGNLVGSASVAILFNWSGTGVLNLEGNLTGGITPGGQFALTISSGTVNLTGNATAGNNGSAIANTGGILNMTGQVIGGSRNDQFGAAIRQTAGSMTLSGNVSCPSIGQGINCSGGNVTITAGNATGGTASTANAINNSAASNLVVVNGQATGGSQAPAIANTSTATIRCTRVVGNAYGPGNTAGLTAQVGVANSGLGIVEIEQMEYGTFGQSPVSGTGIRLRKASTNVAVFNFCDTAGAKTLIDATQNAAMPAAANVRSGVSYASGALTGSCAVPAASSVAFGVPVDNTTGTAVLTPAAIRAELATELARIDTTISSRLSPSGTLATVTTLTNAPTVPTAAAIASQVRSELSVELGRVDSAVSSRLASADYTTPPTTSAIATAVEGSLLNEGDGQAVLNAIVGAIGNSNVDQVALVAAIRSDLERTGGKIDSIPTTAAPTAAQNATAVWGAATKEITGGTVTNLTNAPASVTPSDIWSHATRTLTSASGPTAIEIRQEIDSNSTQLSGIKSKTDNLPASPAATSDIPSANILAIKAKTDLLETTRLAQCSTVATTGAQLAAALS